MIRELLKRIRQEAILPEDIDDEIQAYLAQPEPEPVAQVGGAKAINWFDKHIPKGAYLYTFPPEQSARFAEQVSNETLTRVVETLEAQLAVLQAKREPLSDAQIAVIWEETPGFKDELIDNFARAIEAAHGIGGE